MKRVFWILALLLVPSLGWGADTWYVRPVADCPINGNGTAYACASTPGGVGAWSTFLNISWTESTGVDDGDTLKVCGSFVSADKRNTTTMIDVNASGSNGSPITITGDCSADGGATTATLDCQSSVRWAIILGTPTPDASYIVIRDFTLQGENAADTGGVISMAAGTGVELRNCTINANKQGLTCTGTSFVIDSCNFTSTTLTQDTMSFGTATVSGTVSNNIIRSNATENGSDCIDIDGTNVTAMTISGNTFYKGTGDKSTITPKNGTGVYTISGNIFNVAGSYGVRTEDGFDGTVNLDGNKFNVSGASTVAIQFDNTSGTGTCAVTNNAIYGGYDQLNINDQWTATVYHNVFYGATRYGIYSGGTAPLGPTSVNIRNNVFYGSATKYINSWGYEDAMVLDYNLYFGSAAGNPFRLNNTEYANLAAVVAGTTYEDNGLEADPLLADGANADFRLKPGSPAINSGVDAGVTTDLLDQTRPCRGAYDRGSVEACYHLWLVGE